MIDLLYVSYRIIFDGISYILATNFDFFVYVIRLDSMIVWKKLI